MFADMVGYSRRLEEDEERNSTYAARSIQLFKSLIGDYGGNIENIAGDGVLALFGSAEQALRFSIQVQTEFREEAVWGDGEPIQFRIGLNVGEITDHDGVIRGHCVNVAARVQALAEPGRIYVTGAIHNAVRDRAWVAFRSLGRPALKNLSDPIEVFEVDRTPAPLARAESVASAHASLAPAPVKFPSIAVLALENLTGQAANDHLCEGIVADVIANLTRFRNLLVIARHSAFLFSLKSQSASEIGRRLGVRYLLAGTLRRAGKRLRIGVDLVDAGSEAVLWSDTFDIDMKQIFALQDEITGAVASRLALQIDAAEQKRESQYPRDMRAYGLVLRSQHLLLQFTRDTNAHARRLCEEAMEIAPDYSRAYSTISRACNLEWRYSWSSDPEASLDKALEFARGAIERDQLDARGFAELGFVYLYKRRHDESVAEYVRALALNPNDADIIAEYADCLVYAGNPAKSVELLEKAMRLNPYYPDWYLWNLGDAFDTLQRPADVIAAVRRMRNPSEGRRLLIASLAHLGRLEEAREQDASSCVSTRTSRSAAGVTAHPIATWTWHLRIGSLTPCGRLGYPTKLGGIAATPVRTKPTRSIIPAHHLARGATYERGKRENCTVEV
jgi:TolB-like protein/class 3 adenylate cyclase/Tfp pilus assembly protein PilF